MIRSIQGFFSEKIYPSFHCLGNRLRGILKCNEISSHSNSRSATGNKDHLLVDSFVHTPRLVPAKFDSIADRLMDQMSTPKKQSISDNQQLFLQTTANCFNLHEKGSFNNRDIFQQLNRLAELLTSIVSEHSIAGTYNNSFLREIIHNICLDLNVILVNLDDQITIESDTRVS